MEAPPQKAAEHIQLPVRQHQSRGVASGVDTDPVHGAARVECPCASRPAGKLLGLMPRMPSSPRNLRHSPHGRNLAARRVPGPSGCTPERSRRMPKVCCPKRFLSEGIPAPAGPLARRCHLVLACRLPRHSRTLKRREAFLSQRPSCLVHGSGPDNTRVGAKGLQQDRIAPAPRDLSLSLACSFPVSALNSAALAPPGPRPGGRSGPPQQRDSASQWQQKMKKGTGLGRQKQKRAKG